MSTNAGGPIPPGLYGVAVSDYPDQLVEIDAIAAELAYCDQRHRSPEPVEGGFE